MKKAWVLVCLFCLPLAAWGDGNNYGAASYLRQGAGARASGMGGAFVAVADDATAGYWNPAGLSQMELNEYQAALEYAFLPNNLSTSYASYCFLWPGVGNFSAAWMNFSEGTLEGRDESGNVLPDINASENTFFLSYGRKFYGWAKGLSLGASLKVLQQGVGDYSAVGPGLDVAALWQPSMAYDHTLGLNVQNLFQRVYWSNLNTTDYSLVNAKAGVALKFLRSDDELYFNHLITALDLEFSEYKRFNLRAGVEYWYLSSLGLRAGYNGQEVTAGASYRPENYEIDYAFHYDLTDVGAHQHRLSLLLRFGGSPQPMEKAYIPESGDSSRTPTPIDTESKPAPLPSQEEQNLQPGKPGSETPTPQTEQAQTTPQAVPEPAKPASPETPTPSPAGLPTSVPTPEIASIPTPMPAVKEAAEGPKESRVQEAEPKYNFLTINPFGTSAISAGFLGTFKLEYERRVAKKLTVSLVGLYFLESLLFDFTSASGNGTYAEYGLGLEPRYYFSNEDTPKGYWLGAIGAFRTGSIDLSYPATYDQPAYVKKENTQVVMAGFETGYKWVFWNWFTVSPYFGTYYEQRKFIGVNSTQFYTGGGVNVGMAF